MPTLIDAEAGGDISRVIIHGGPVLRGASVAEQCADFAARHDALRWKLMQPPYGALHMCPVLLLDDPAGAADFGVIIMESMGYPPLSGSNLFCAAAVALETGRVAMREPETRLRVATPGGTATLSARCRDGRCRSVELEGLDARLGAVVDIPATAADPPTVATRVSAGVDYAVVDAVRLGAALTPRARAALLAHGQRIAGQAETDFVLFHAAVDPGTRDPECRVAVYQAPSVICRSPTGTGTAALLALGHARGWIGPGTTLATRSPTGGRFRGRILAVHPGGGGVSTAVSGAVRTMAPLSVP